MTDQTTPLRRVLIVTFLASLGTGVFWHGLSFIALHSYGFSQTRNLVMYAVMGAIYTLGAWRAGRLTRRVASVLSARGVLVTCIGGQALACVLPIAVDHEWALWLSAAAVTWLSAIAWPIIESYVSAGRHGPEMRRAIAAFNLTWMPATIVSMLVMAPLLEHHGRWPILGLGVLLVPALIVSSRFASRPAPHEPEHASGHVTPEYPYLLRSARVLLPLSYLVSSALAPILPYLLEVKLDVDVALQTPVSATWMLLRVVAMLVLWRLPFWHGRWGTLLLAGVAMSGGFGMVVLAPSLWVLMVGLALFGAGIGVIYYAALYYAMAVGRGEVDASGTHEALIGIGYGAGPLAGLLGSKLGGGGIIVSIVWATVAIGSIGSIVPYLQARRARRRE